MKKFVACIKNDFFEERIQKTIPKGTIIGYTDFTEDLNTYEEIEVTQEQLDDITSYIVSDGKLVKHSEEYLLSRKQDELREQRKPLLEAFDKYKSNVILGLEGGKEIPDEILSWYFDILDLKEDAINNPPDKIKYYLT